MTAGCCKACGGALHFRLERGALLPDLQVPFRKQCHVPSNNCIGCLCAPCADALRSPDFPHESGIAATSASHPPLQAQLCTYERTRNVTHASAVCACCLRRCAALTVDDDGLLPEWLVFHELVATSKPFLRQARALSTAPASFGVCFAFVGTERL